jgi:hypothetical protein
MTTGIGAIGLATTDTACAKSWRKRPRANNANEAASVRRRQMMTDCKTETRVTCLWKAEPRRF